MRTNWRFNMEFYISAALPLLYYDDYTLKRCVDFLRKCDCEPAPQEVSDATNIPIEICQAKIPEVLILNRYLIRKNEAKEQRRHRIIDYLNGK